MATPLGVAPNYYTLFATRQGGPAPYAIYADHLDVNFVAIKNTMNQLVSEMIGLGGPNAVIGLDLLKRDDPAGPLPAGTDGILGGRGGYLVTINGVDANRLNVAPGVAIAGGRRVELLVGLTSVFPGVGNITGGSGFVFVDVNGQPGFSDTGGGGVLDLAECFHNGTVYTSIVMLPAALFDGDEFQFQLQRPAIFGFATKTFKSAARRIRALEQKLAGIVLDDEGGVIGPVGLSPGTIALPSIVLTSGNGATNDSATGWYRAAADVWAFVAGGVEQFRLAAGGAQMTNSARFRAENATESLATSALVLSSVSFDAADESYDVGSWHAGTSADWTCPTNGIGVYQFILTATFDETGAGANTGQRSLAIQVNGVDKGQVISQAVGVGGGVTRLSASVEMLVTAGQVVRARAAQNSTATMNLTGIEFSGSRRA